MEQRKRIGVVVVIAVIAALIAVWKLRNNDGDSGSNASAATPERRAKPRTRQRLINPRTQPRGTIAGTIRVAGTTRPIAGARVCAWAHSRQLATAETREPTCATADAAGRYEINNLVAARYRVFASADGYMAARYKTRHHRVSVAPGEHVDRIDIVLRAGGVRITGVVKDVGGGPVGGALVSVQASANWDPPVTITTSDASGRFSAWTAPGRIEVSAAADGYAPGNKEAIAPGQHIELYLTPESVLGGRVIRVGSGEPVANARVQLNRGGWWGGNNGVAFTDASGRFRITRLQPGRYKPVARARGAYGEAAQSVLLGFAETREDVVIEVHPAFVVSGRIVVGKHKASCRDGGVRLHDKVSGRYLSADADDDGNVVFDAVLPGNYKTRVHCRDTLPADGYADVRVASDDVTGLEWRVSGGAAITGTVKTAAGEPVAGATVRARSATDKDHPRARRGGGWTQTDSDGSFEMRGLPAGDYSLRCYSDSQPSTAEPTKLSLAAGEQTTVVLTLPAAGKIRGSVVDQRGTPVKDVDVTARGKSWNLRGGSRTKDDGTFVIEGVAAGSYRVVAYRGWRRVLRKPGSSDDDTQGVRTQVVAGETAEVKLIVESESETIRGRVVDEIGKPVTDAFIKAQRESEKSGASRARGRRRIRWGWWGSGSPIMTDTEGNFTVEHLSPGRYTVRAYRKGGGEALVERVKAGTSVTITIKAVGSIAGTVKLAGGGVPADFSVSLRDDTTGFSRSESFFRTSGAWSMTDLPAGNYTVSVGAAEGTAKQTVKLDTGQNRDGLKFVLEGRVDITGRVVDLTSKKPVPGMSVWVSPVKGSGGASFPSDRRKNISGPDGRFSLPKVPSGRVYVGAYPVDWENGTYQYNRVIRVLEPGAGTIDVGDLPVLKRRLPLRERNGDLGYTIVQQDPGTDPSDRTYVVALVRTDGPAAGSGLKAGDEIVAVDGHDVRGENYMLYYALVRAREGTTLRLGLARGATVSITLGKPR